MIIIDTSAATIKNNATIMSISSSTSVMNITTNESILDLNVAPAEG